jgi:uncharacterized iron-regulated membrane protein
MFLTGGITLFREQLELWEEPLAQRSPTSVDLQPTLERGLDAKGSIPEDLWFYPRRDGRGEAMLVYWDSGLGHWTKEWIDTERATLVPKRERLAEFLYSIHFLWHDATGRWLYTVAGLLAVALLLALVTGILIHLKDLVRHFHQFRIDKSRRVLWSEMHKVLGVMGLPFQLMYAYTGAFIVLGPLLLQVFTGPVFGGNETRAAALAFGRSPEPATIAGLPASVLSLDQLAARARATRPTLELERIRLLHHGRANGVIEISGREKGSFAAQGSLRLREVDGEVLPGEARRGMGASRAVRQWIQGLHLVHFGGILARVLFLILALATCLTILSGNFIWLARRESRQRHSGNRVLARLNVGIGAGAWVAIGALFLSSRLLPLTWTGRGAAEELTFVAALGACVLWAFLSRDESALWSRQLGLAGLFFLPVPLLAARWSPAGLFGSGPRLSGAVAVDVALCLAGAALCAGAWRLHRASSMRVSASVPVTRPSSGMLAPTRAHDV